MRLTVSYDEQRFPALLRELIAHDVAAIARLPVQHLIQHLNKQQQYLQYYLLPSVSRGIDELDSPMVPTRNVATALVATHTSQQAVRTAWHTLGGGLARPR